MSDNILIKYLPDLMKEYKEIQEITSSLSPEFKELDYYIKDFIKQLNPLTATWGLSLFEEILGLPINPDLNYNKRRSLIKTKLRGQGKVNDLMIKDIVELFGNKNVDVRFNGGILIELSNVYEANLPNIMYKVINEIKPAHLDLETFILQNMILNISLITYEFPAYLRITNCFNIEEKKPGISFPILNRSQLKTYEFSVYYGITDIFRTETQYESTTNININSTTSENSVTFLRAGTNIFSGKEEI